MKISEHLPEYTNQAKNAGKITKTKSFEPYLDRDFKNLLRQGDSSSPTPPPPPQELHYSLPKLNQNLCEQIHTDGKSSCKILSALIKK